MSMVDHTIHQNHHPTRAAFYCVLFELCFHLVYTRLSIGATTPGHHSPACCSPLPRLWSAVTELFKWQRGLLDNKRRQREIRGKRAAMITGSPAWEADNPERHHLAVWKQREVGLRWQKAAHYAWFQSALLHVWIAGCNYAISGSITQDRTYVKVLW